MWSSQLFHCGFLAQGGNLQRHFPSIAGMCKELGKGWVLQLTFKVAVKIGFIHRASLLKSRSLTDKILH